MPADLTMVQVFEEKPACYEHVGNDDLNSQEFLLNDLYTVVGTNPLLLDEGVFFGPTDILGFRNDAVPWVTSLLTSPAALDTARVT